MRWGLAAALGLCLLVLGVFLIQQPQPLPTRPMDREVPGLSNGSLRIVALGTNLTARGIWPEALAERLEACFGQPVRVERVARAGADVAWAQSAISRLISGVPDLVLMEFGINDADFINGLSLNESRRIHGEILDTLRGVPVVLMTMSPAYGMQGWRRPFQGNYDASYREMAAARRLGLMDFAPRWAGLPQDWAADGLNPDPAVQAKVMVGPLSVSIGRAAGLDCG